MSNINRVMLSGNLTRSPELRTTPGGSSVLQLGLACNGSRRNQQTGQWEDVPNYFDLVMFGGRAEKLAGYLSKGAKVAVEGKLRWRQWQDQQTGQNRSRVEVVVDEIEFLSGQGQRQQQQNAAFSDDCIPF